MLSDIKIKQERRHHLGFSEIGKDERLMWLKNRWCFSNDISQRQERIFGIGHYVEDLVMAQLSREHEVINKDSEGNQIRYSLLEGHLGGSQDGAVNVPDDGIYINGEIHKIKGWALLEVKSAKNSEYNLFVKDGVKQWRSGYYDQAQSYMSNGKYSHCIFIVVNKDTGAMHCELIEHDPMIFDGLMMKAKRIFNDKIPLSSWENRRWYEAKFLSEDEQEIYWGDRLPYPHCRTCSKSAMHDKGQWKCSKYNKVIPADFQEKGCTKHIYMPQFDAIDVITKVAWKNTEETNIKEKSLSSFDLYNLGVALKNQKKAESALGGLSNIDEVFNVSIDSIIY